MKIETERLILRELKEKDTKDIVEGLNNLEISQWMRSIPYPYKIGYMVERFEKMKKKAKEKPRIEYVLVIELKNEKKAIGNMGLHKVDRHQGTGGFGYWINRNYHGKGYGSEALEAMIDFAFNKLKLRRLEAEVFPGNPSSGKLLEKYGFVKEGLKRQSSKCIADGKIKDTIMYGLLRKEYNIN